MPTPVPSSLLSREAYVESCIKRAKLSSPVYPQHNTFELTGSPTKSFSKALSHKVEWITHFFWSRFFSSPIQEEVTSSESLPPPDILPHPQGAGWWHRPWRLDIGKYDQVAAGVNELRQFKPECKEELDELPFYHRHANKPYEEAIRCREEAYKTFIQDAHTTIKHLMNKLEECNFRPRKSLLEDLLREEGPFQELFDFLCDPENQQDYQFDSTRNAFYEKLDPLLSLLSEKKREIAGVQFLKIETRSKERLLEQMQDFSPKCPKHLPEERKKEWKSSMGRHSKLMQVSCRQFKSIINLFKENNYSLDFPSEEQNAKLGQLQQPIKNLITSEFSEIEPQFNMHADLLNNLRNQVLCQEGIED